MLPPSRPTGRAVGATSTAHSVPSTLYDARVIATRWLGEHCLRVCVTAPELSEWDFAVTDHSVKLYFYPPATPLPHPMTLQHARELRPSVAASMRTYTVAGYDPRRCELDIDFAVHPASRELGVATGWAVSAAVGDRLLVVGPSRGYRPPTGGALLLLADDSALPAVAAMLSHRWPGCTITAVVEVDDPGDERELGNGQRPVWLHRRGVPAQRSLLLLQALREMDLQPGIKVWAGAERGIITQLRTHLLTERGLSRRDVHATNYWQFQAAGS